MKTHGAYKDMKVGPTKVLHLITSLDTGGTEPMLFRLLSFMDKKRFSNQVVCLTDIGTVGEKIINLGIPVYSLNMPRGVIRFRGLFNLWRYLRLARPTILQTWLYHSDLLGFIVGRIAGIRNICWNIRCSYMDLGKYSPSTKWAINLCSFFSSSPKVVITNSVKAMNFHVSHGYRAKQWRVIPNGVDLEKFRPDQRAKQRLMVELSLYDNKKRGITGTTGRGKKQTETFLIGFIARYDPMKDHPTFIKAACLLLEEKRNVHFVLAGRGITTENRILARLIPHEWRSHFHLLGRRDDIESLTAALDIASLASHGEGFPNVVSEAMACGVPCVVMDVGDSSMIVDNTGRVIPPGDPQALAVAWNELIELEEEERRSLGTAARKRIMDHFELSRIVRQYETLYTEVMTKDE